ncbi:hypothetical protein X975_20958, partial [Stegodyphus mimosarum]
PEVLFFFIVHCIKSKYSRAYSYIKSNPHLFITHYSESWRYSFNGSQE